MLMGGAVVLVGSRACSSQDPRPFITNHFIFFVFLFREGLSQEVRAQERRKGATKRKQKKQKREKTKRKNDLRPLMMSNNNINFYFSGISENFSFESIIKYVFDFVFGARGPNQSIKS